MHLVLFQDCLDGNIKFRYSTELTYYRVGDVYHISGSDYNGYASIIEYAEIGEIYDSYATIFQQVFECPKVEQEIFEEEVIEEGVVGIYQIPEQIETSPGSPITEFCVSPQYSSLGTNVGKYTLASQFYDTYIYYSGETGGFIYFNTDKSIWCLSSTLGGDCLLTGPEPCYREDYPDLYTGIVFSGSCPTPTPTIESCEMIDFEAIFNCDLSSTPTPTPTITPAITTTPTITNTPSSSGGLAVEFGLTAYTYNYPSATPSITPSITPTNNTLISGNVSYVILDKEFTDGGVKVLTECSTSEVFYANQDLVFGGVPIIIGQSIRAVVDGTQRCFEYTSNSSLTSSNIYLDQILEVNSSCSGCLITPTPTLTPTITPTMTATPPTTPTPTPSSGLVYVFQSCLPIGLNENPTIIIQTQSYQSPLSNNSVIKDLDGNCWEFLGAYSNTYIIPINVNPITYTGNYFGSSTSTIFASCGLCFGI